MQATLDRPATPSRRRFDVDAYHRMAETGILAPEDRVELIDGEVIGLAPIGAAHGGKVDRLTSLVARIVAEGRVIVRVRGPLRLDRRNEPQPDLMLLSPKVGFYKSAYPTAADGLLLVEVADSSLARDCGPRFTPVTACPRSGLSIWSAAWSRSAGSGTRRATRSARRCSKAC